MFFRFATNDSAYFRAIPLPLVMSHFRTDIVLDCETSIEPKLSEAELPVEVLRK